MNLLPTAAVRRHFELDPVFTPYRVRRTECERFRLRTGGLGGVTTGAAWPAAIQSGNPDKMSSALRGETRSAVAVQVPLNLRPGRAAGAAPGCTIRHSGTSQSEQRANHQQTSTFCFVLRTWRGLRADTSTAVSSSKRGGLSTEADPRISGRHHAKRV
jgi:hypothetical protein